MMKVAVSNVARRYGVTRPLADGSPRYEIITFTGSFHGRTFGAMSATAQAKIHGGFGPIVPGFVYVPFNDIETLKAAITEKTVAILLEPVQGESGVHPVTADFLRAAADLCKTNDMLLLLDEVQCGLGRTGTLGGWRAIIPGDEIKPDAVSWAKSIGSGFPLGSFWIQDRPVGEGQGQLCDLLGPGSHGTTYGGSPLACTVGLTTLGVILRDRLTERSATLDTQIATEVSRWNHPAISAVRAFGMMIGFELDAGFFDSHPAVVASGRPASIWLARQMLDIGLMVVPAGTHVVRWLPPMNIQEAHVAEALQLFRQALDAAQAPA